ncbi:hypothetical protein WME73_02515 [Sorangium sp. So ce302]
MERRRRPGTTAARPNDFVQIESCIVRLAAPDGDSSPPRPDNLKGAVVERHGDAIRFHPTLQALPAHYHFEPRPVAVARGNEKGRVERAIRYVREAFFEARSCTDVGDLNRQATEWTTSAALGWRHAGSRCRRRRRRGSRG